MGVTQTTDGYIWLATEEGLVRYDGIAFRTFDEQNSRGLPDRLIRSVAASRDGGLWVGTRSGLASYRNGAFTSLVDQTGFSDDVYDLCEGRDGSLWFSSDHGLFRFRNGQTKIYTVADGLPDNRITAIAQGEDGSIWAGTRAGLVRFAKERFTAFAMANETLSNSINALSVGSWGDIWIGTSNGEIDRWRAGQITRWWRDPHHQAQVQCLREDKDGTLWIAFQRWGLGRMRGRTLEILTRTEGLPGEDPDWIFEDRERGLWLGWADLGFSTLRDGKFTTFGKREGLSTDHTASVMQSKDGSIWAGTEDGGLNRLHDGKIETYSERDGLNGKDFVSILQTRDGNIWSGSDRGFLARIANGRVSLFGQTQSVPPRISALLEDREGNLWVGFEEQDGVSRFRGGRFEHIRLKGRTKGLAEAPDGALWIASYGGGVTRLFHGKFQTFDEAQGLSSRKVISVYTDAAGVVWAGTAQAGLNRIKGGKITTYSVIDGLFDSTVGAILEDDYGYLWMTSSRGIFKVKKQELNDFAEGRIAAVHASSFGTADGLRSEECSIGAQPAAWKAKDGTLWFATTGGLAFINPSRLRTEPAPPEINLDEKAYAGRPIERGITELEAGLGRLDFEFAAPNFVNPLSERVRYRLDGYDSNWVEAGARRTATYTNLAPREYVFRVQASGPDGGDFRETRYRFRLLPKYYQTTWFRVFAALGIFFLIWKLYRIRLRYLMVRNHELESKVQSRTAELRKAMEAAELAQEMLREQATRDTLTGLWNRRAIFAALECEIKSCSAASVDLSVLMIDLDHFKAINDRMGHLAGDQVLREAAARFTRCIGEGEAVGRYGGEEMLVVLPGAPVVAALQRAEELRTTLERTPIPTDAGDVRVTCSIGLSVMRPGQTGRALMDAADNALYEAKASGRNCVRVHNGRQQDQAAVQDLRLQPTFGYRPID